MNNYDIYQRRNQLQRVVDAHNLLERKNMSIEDARVELRAMADVDRWLMAEARYKQSIRDWLNAEKKWQLRMSALNLPTYAAGRRGWEMMKQYVPTLDGVGRFEDLSESLQFRYAAFAAAVVGELPPPEVKSQKQQICAPTYTFSGTGY